MQDSAETKPLVSIIVRTKDRPKLLVHALQSIYAQTYRPIEVVVVNDGGCELTAESLKKALGDVALKYIRLDKNTGRAHAGNVGSKNARGDYVGFLDDDDELYPEHIDTLVSYLRQSMYKVAYSDAEIVLRRYVPEQASYVTEKQTLLSPNTFSYEELLVGNYIPFMTLLFSRDVLVTFDEDFDLYEDWDLLIRVSRDHPFFHILKTTARYNQWSRDLQINQADAKQMRAAHLKVMRKHRDKILPEMILNLKDGKEELRFQLQGLKQIEDTVLEKDRLILDRDDRIRQLDFVVGEKDKRILQLEDAVTEKNTQIMELNTMIGQRNGRILQLEETLRDNDGRIRSLQEDRDGLKLLIHQMRSTIGWKALEKFRVFRNSIVTVFSRRGAIYDAAVQTYRTLKNEGFSAFGRKLKVKVKTGILGTRISRDIAGMNVTRRILDPDDFRVLFLISPWAGVTNRYRAYNMKEYLNRMGKESEVMGIEEIDTRSSFALDFDIIVIHRIPMNGILKALIEKCRELKIPVIFDLDDYLFDVTLTDRIDEIRRMNDADRNKWIEHVKGCRETLEACDYFIGTTDFIVNKVRELGKRAFIIRNGLNRIQIESSSRALLNAKRDPALINIGYFSGTKTHQKDFEVVIKPLAKIMDSYKNVRLCIGGFLDLNSNFDKFSDRIERLPYVDWKELPYNIARTDINIAPLEPDNPFCEAKSELKYFESALLKVPSVCTPTDTFKRVIKDGENGLLASSEEEWYASLSSLIEDAALRHKLGERAYTMVIETYSPEIQGQKMLETYREIIRDYKDTRHC